MRRELDGSAPASSRREGILRRVGLSSTWEAREDVAWKGRERGLCKPPSPDISCVQGSRMEGFMGIVHKEGRHWQLSFHKS